MSKDNTGATSAESSVQGSENYEDFLQVIPEKAKTKSVLGQFWVWFGANVAPINWLLGALGITMGLGLWETIAVILIGNLIGMSIFGFMVLLGQKTGLTGMLLGRRVFGRFGNYLPSFIQCCVNIGWCAINTWIILDLIIAILGSMGIVDPSVDNFILKVVIAAIIMTAQVLISVFGYNAIASFEKWTMPFTIAIFAIMTVAAWGFIGVDWSYAGTIAEGSPDRMAAITTVMTAIGIGWGFTWLAYACDYSRFVSRSVPKPKLFGASALGQFIPVLWLGIFGATLATNSATVDPGQLIVDNFGAMAIPVLLVVLHAPIAVNILNIYSFTLSVQSLDLKLNRRIMSIIVGVLAWFAVIFFLNMGDIANTLSSWLSSVAGWAAVWGAIMIVHFFINERKYSDFSGVLGEPGKDNVPLFRWQSLVAFFAGVIMLWACSYGSIPFFMGPIAIALGGVDLSWLGGFVTSFVVYLALSHIDKKSFETPPSTLEEASGDK